MAKSIYRDDQNLIESFSLLETALDYFDSELHKVSAREVALYDIPPIQKQDEALLIGDDYDTIAVEKIPVETWKSYVNSAISKLFEHDGNSTRIIRRFPGLIVFDQPPEGLLDAMRHVNYAKQSFKQVVTDNDLSPNERYYWVHGLFPGLVTLYAYRQIPFYESAFKAAYLNWGSRPTTQIKTKAEILEFLQQQKRKLNPLASDQDALQSIEQGIHTVEQSSFATYKFKYQQKVAPHCRLMYSDPQQSPASQSLKCSLPIFITHQAEKPLTISGLNNYQPKTKRKTRTDDQLLIPLKSGGFYGSYKIHSKKSRKTNAD